VVGRFGAPVAGCPLDVGCLDIGPKVQHSGRRCNSTKLSEKNGDFSSFPKQPQDVKQKDRSYFAGPIC